MWYTFFIIQLHINQTFLQFFTLLSAFPSPLWILMTRFSSIFCSYQLQFHCFFKDVSFTLYVYTIQSLSDSVNSHFQIVVFRVVTPCSMIAGYHHSEVTCCIYLQGHLTLKMEVVYSMPRRSQSECSQRWKTWKLISWASTVRFSSHLTNSLSSLQLVFILFSNSQSYCCI